MVFPFAMEPPSSRRVSVINQTGKRLPIPRIKQVAEHALAGVPGGVCILLTNDEEIRKLNKQFRDLDEATDVLTFPASPLPNAPLGDIAISVEYAERQATLRGVPLDVELQYLAIHGALHLVGWNDEDDGERERMLAEMNRVGTEAGLPPDPEWSSLLHSANL